MCIFCHVNLAVSLTGSVKDSVVGEERIAQYLLAVLNTRSTPLHWKHINNRRVDGITYEAKENDRYNLKNLKQRRGSPNRSDIVYVEVTYGIMKYDTLKYPCWKCSHCGCQIPNITFSKRFKSI